METKVIIGPPGTGKTTTIINEMQALLSTYSPEEIAVCSFTRAAAREAAERASSLASNRLVFGTIHSLCFRLLGLSRDYFMNVDRWEQFAKEYNLTIRRNFALGLSEPNSDDEKALACIFFIQSCGAEVEKWPERKTGKLPYYPQFGMRYVNRINKMLDEFKRRNGLVYFSDMLKMVLEERLYLPAKVLFVDEAQDLSALQGAIVDMWAEKLDKLIIAGDDDQAVYEWSGADPSWLISKANQFGCTVLKQSYRLPSRVLSLCQRIAGRIRTRVAKQFLAAQDGGLVKYFCVGDRRYLIKKLADKNVRVLTRTNGLVSTWAELLKEFNIPWEAESREGTYGSFWADPYLASALSAIKDLCAGKAPPRGNLAALFSFIPSNHPLAPWGIKTDIAEGRPVDLSPLFEQAAKDPWGLLVKFDQNKLAQLKTVVKDWELERPRWKISTIHTAKGREADYVIIDHPLPKQLKKLVRLPDSEHRVAYTAASRAKKGVIILDEKRYYPY